MAYEKINWNELTPLNSANLNKMETQYYKALEGLAETRKDDTEPLIVYVVNTFPSPSEARMIFNTSTNRFYYSDGNGWLLMAKPGDVGVE